MKFLILLCSLSIFGGAAYAQNLNLVSTYPTDGAFGVETDSVILTFDQKFDPFFFAGDSVGAGVFFFLSPEDSVEYTNFKLSDDSLSITYYVNLSADTDYIGFLVSAVSKDGFILENPALFQFTTSSTRGEFVVEGTLPQPILEKAIEESPFEDIILALSPNPFDFGPDNCEGEECEDDDIEPIYAAFVDKETGEFSVSGVREGEYYPLGLNFFGEGVDNEGDEFFIPEFYYYDPDEDQAPDFITVNSTNAPTDTLSGIDLTIFELVPISFADAIELAQSTLDSLDNDPVLVGGATFYASIGILEGEDGHEEDSVVFESSAMQKMEYHLRPAEIAEANDHQTIEDIFDILTNPSGLQFEWTLYGYDSVKDSAFSIIATPFGSEFLGYISEEEAELPDTVNFSDIASLPSSFIDSDSAATIIEENGGWEFRDYFSSEEFSVWSMELQALNNFWDVHEDTLIQNLPVMWSGRYYGFTYNPGTKTLEEGYLVIYLDMETGDVIYTDSFIGGFGEESLLTFSDAIDLTLPYIAGMDNEPIILGGGTFWASVGLFEDGDGTEENTSDDSKNKFSAVINKIVAEHSEHEDEGFPEFPFPFLSEPNGLQIEWDVYGYDAVKDSAFVLSVSEYGIEFGGYIGEEEAELPDSVDFSDIEPLPVMYIDSDSAMTIIEENGGWEFRDEFSGLYGFWEVELEALNNFWELNEDTVISEVPVMWAAEYYGYSFDPFTNNYVEGYFVIYLDIETGDIIYSDSEIVGEMSGSHITFDKAVDLADSLINAFGDGFDVMGGLTHYNNVPIIFKDARKKVPDSFRAKVTAAMEDDGPVPGITVQPDGYAFSWEIFVYNGESDSVYVLNVTEFDVFIADVLGSDDVEDGVVFSDMKPLSFTHIDSDSAAKLIDAEGALAFRTSMEESELDWYWESELQLLHQYWDYPPDPTPTAPITWRAEYYAWAFDSETQEYHEDSLVVFIDAESGAVLYSTVIVSNDAEPDTPDRFSLSQNYPNPFNPSTNIPFQLSEASKVEINVYSILGQKVATIVNELYPAGSHSIQWNAQDLASGVYIYRMQAGGFTQTRKFVLLK